MEREDRDGGNVRAEEGETDTKVIQRRNTEGNGDGERINEGKLQGEREEENGENGGGARERGREGRTR